MTPTGIEPATFRYVAQCLNRLRQSVPICWLSVVNIAKAQNERREVYADLPSNGSVCCYYNYHYHRYISAGEFCLPPQDHRVNDKILSTIRIGSFGDFCNTRGPLRTETICVSKMSVTARRHGHIT